MDAGLELKLMTPGPIFVGAVPIYPIPLRVIALAGYDRFNAEFGLLCLSEARVLELTGQDVQEVGVFNFLAACALRDPELMKALLHWLSVLTRERVIFSEKRLVFTSGAFDIGRDNFADVQEVIRRRNGLQEEETADEDPANDAARRVLARRREEREKRRRAKQADSGDALGLGDLVSILACGLGLPIRDVLEYDLYQMSNQISRLKIRDDYEVSIQALLHGAKKDDVELQHWITKIKRAEA